MFTAVHHRAATHVTYPVIADPDSVFLPAVGALLPRPGSFAVYLIGDCAAGGGVGLPTNACSLDSAAMVLLASFGSTGPEAALQRAHALIRQRSEVVRSHSAG